MLTGTAADGASLRGDLGFVLAADGAVVQIADQRLTPTVAPTPAATPAPAASPAAVATSAPAEAGALATTGSGTDLAAALAAVRLLLGAALVLVARRRTSRTA